jgi:hypothetical protein
VALVVAVNGADDARRAATAAQALGVPLMLVSAPGAGGFAGCGWFAALVRATQGAFPQLYVTWALDCGDRAGDVMEALASEALASEALASEALAAGRPLVIFTGGDAAAARLRSVAAARGATLRQDRPDALILRAGGDVVAAARDRLSRSVPICGENPP